MGHKHTLHLWFDTTKKAAIAKFQKVPLGIKKELATQPIIPTTTAPDQCLICG
jgi:hypothetical protein